MNWPRSIWSQIKYFYTRLDMLDAYLWLNYDKPSMMININYNNICNLALKWFYVYLFDSLNSNVCAWIRYWLNKISIIYLLLIFINQRKFEYERQPMCVCVCVCGCAHEKWVLMSFLTKQRNDIMYIGCLIISAVFRSH